MDFCTWTLFTHKLISMTREGSVPLPFGLADCTLVDSVDEVEARDRT